MIFREVNIEKEKHRWEQGAGIGDESSSIAISWCVIGLMMLIGTVFGTHYSSEK